MNEFRHTTPVVDGSAELRHIPTAVDGSAKFNTVKPSFTQLQLSFTQLQLLLAALHAFPSAQQWQLIAFIRSDRPGGPLSMLRQVIPSHFPVIDWREIELRLRSEIFGKRKVFRQFDKYFSELYIT